MRSVVSKLALAALVSAAALLGTGAHAFPSATLTFSDPTGTVGANESIEVYVDLAIDAGGPDLFFDPNAGFPFGLPAGDVPTQSSYQDAAGKYHTGTITDITNASLGMWFGCSGTFTSTCNPGAYAFTFASGFQNLFSPDGSLTLNAGSTYRFLFGTFSPVAGPVAAGTYTFYNALLGLSIYGTGVDGSGNPAMGAGGNLAEMLAVSFPYETCSNEAASCAFTRTVLAVPEPQTYAMLLAGLGLVGLAACRRRAAAATAARPANINAKV